MDIEKALKLKRGDIVYCPADRGNPNFCGTVASDITDKTISKNIKGYKYIWIEVLTPFGHKSVWPSNRLNTQKRVKQ